MSAAELAQRRASLSRQVGHWRTAAARLAALDDLAAPGAWAALERYLGVALRETLHATTRRLVDRGELLGASLDAAHSGAELERVRRQLLGFRQQYLRTETTIEFYADAVNSRTSPRLAGLLRSCDILAHRSMAQALDPLRKPTPIVLTYVDNGLGASILKAGLRLWDGGTDSPAAAIKIVRHNLLRPTALIHEAGHQVAHLIGWNAEQAEVFQRGLASAGRGVADVWSGWASEITADAFAFAHTGYAAVVNLHDVLAGGPSFVFRLLPGDPHPISFLRVLLGTAMCRHCYGAGPWDALEEQWRADHLAGAADGDARAVVEASLPLLPAIAAMVLDAPLRSYGGRPLVAALPPERVAPATLIALEARLGAALYTSPHWLWTESLRLLALSGLKAATQPQRAADVLGEQEAWMTRLGGELRAA